MNSDGRNSQIEIQWRLFQRWARQVKAGKKIEDLDLFGPVTVYADLGCRCVDKDHPGIEIKHRGKDKRLTDEEPRLLKKRQPIEPIIGHLKAAHRMDRCHVKGSEGDALYAVL